MRHQQTSRKQDFLKKIKIIDIKAQAEIDSEEFGIFRRKLQNAMRKARNHQEQSSSVVYGGTGR